MAQGVIDKRKRVDYSKVNWEAEYTSDLAKRFNVTSAAIASARRRYAPHTMQLRKASTSWGTRVDWSMRNKDIARQFGKPPSSVAMMRRAHAPETVRVICVRCKAAMNECGTPALAS